MREVIRTYCKLLSFTHGTEFGMDSNNPIDLGYALWQSRSTPTRAVLDDSDLELIDAKRGFMLFLQVSNLSGTRYLMDLKRRSFHLST